MTAELTMLRETGVQSQAGQSAADVQAQVAPQVDATVRRALEEAQTALRESGIQGTGVRVQAPPAPPVPGVTRVQSGPGEQVVLTGDGREIRVHDDGSVTIDGEPVTTESQMTPFPQNDIPQGAVMISVFFFIMIAVVAIGLPLARAFGRRMDRKSVVTTDTAALSGRLERIEQAIETVAVEVERISEGQRFTARLMNEMQQGQQRQLERVPASAGDEPARGRS